MYRTAHDQTQTFLSRQRCKSWVAAIAMLTLSLSGCEVVTVTDVTPPRLDLSDVLQDDKLEDKHPVFDDALIDSRVEGEWSINSSGAVIMIDTPLVRPDYAPEMTILYPSYQAASKVARNLHRERLASVSMLDAKGKQFDDGLYAALDQAYYQGLQGRLVSHVSLIRGIFDKCKPDSQAAAFLTAGLSLSGTEVSGSNGQQVKVYLNQFNRNQIASKPISFYTWNDTLKSCWRFMRFFQQALDSQSSEVNEITAILRNDQSLRDDYQRMIDFYSKLTNEPSRKNLLNFSSGDRNVSLMPPSTSRENELFESLYATGLPPNANLMRELITRIKTGQIDLTPNEDSGWYQYQAFALETFLIPERGAEHDKLLLTKEYKQRLMQAFQATLTSRRETHARQEGVAVGAEAPARKLEIVKPRLRIEPSPTFYLRTARAYAFLQKFLIESIGEETLELLHGLTSQGQRPATLRDELESIKRLFYGLYLVSCEDIGLRPDLGEGELTNSHDCYAQANAWLAESWDDPDLAADRRVSIPIVNDVSRKVTRLWVVVGVRLIELEARYMVDPMIRPTNSPEAAWEDVSRIESQEAIIAVDEFAEVEINGNVSLSREELREICDRHKTKDEIIRALQAR